MSRVFRIISQYWKTISWAVIIFFLSSLSVPKIPGAKLIDIPHFDKFVHFSLYAVLLTLWLIDYFKVTKNPLKRTVLIIIIASVLYGGIMEVIQKVLLQGRSGDFFDFLANTLGIFTALLMFRYITIYRNLALKIFAKRWI